ncbi:4-carboxy muconolactone decarboxylase [Rubrivivax gelatinosus]|uniref:4-carboxy muconolactone decarboxylase n=1 Tax=Rubrivivax gelatinosus TaxID=28068 RepID=A0ABS1DYG2_RUBGE|nr:carboxymuconolactone decarboxylase family protein [Rubrivivax gelatinosus]MBK1615973.1 4-carboxy muconolactone decarboxylase [Rubrivivax gelatinosus]MBK1715131.1 4-carboxy muconolactone decarboxylase [Rubrivivax gelatinosus]
MKNSTSSLAAVAGAALVASAALTCPLPAQAGERMPPVKVEDYNEAQRAAADEFLATRKYPVFGPFSVLIRSPKLMTNAHTMGSYLRYNASIGMPLSEMVILMVARSWSQDYEWTYHVTIAAKQGIKPEVIDAIAEGRRPAELTPDQAVIYDFTDELLRNRRVSDKTYDATLKRFGEQGVLDTAGVVGYYTFLAGIMNTVRTAPVPGVKTLARFPDPSGN